MRRRDRLVVIGVYTGCFHKRKQVTSHELRMVLCAPEMGDL